MKLLDDFVASIPFSLLENPGAIFHQNQQEKIGLLPGKAIGGLMLLHQLYTIAKMPTTPSPVRTHLLKCLAWIGTNMGIGQASLLSEV